MNSRWLAATGCLIGALAMGVTACGGDDDSGGDSGSSGSGGGKTLTVYSSLPLQGASRPQTTALVNGIKLALDQAGGKAGDFTIKYESLDDSTAQAGSWTPEATQANARKVAQDDSAAVVHRRVQLGRLGGLDPDPQRGRGPADQPREHRCGPDLGRAGLQPR